MLAIDVVGLFSDLLSIGVCTTRSWQMSGRMVQELNVCTQLTRYFRHILKGRAKGGYSITT